MAGATLDGELTRRAAGRISFAVAGPEHDPGLRRVLRESRMEGDIALTFEREPDYFAGSNIGGAEDETIVALQDGEVVGLAGCSVRRRYVNGVPRRVGYLGELRLARAVQGRFDILRRGFQFYAARHRHQPADIYFTSIAADNERSRRFLERGLPGMPRYEFLTDFVTLVISTSAAQKSTEGFGGPETGGAPSALTSFLNRSAANFHFAAHWTDADLLALAKHGLAPRDFQVVKRDGEIVACAALWNQRAFKQTLVHGYSHRLRLLRPLLNPLARVSGLVPLPHPGTTLSQAFLSPLHAAVDQEGALLALVRGGLQSARGRGLEMAVLGFAANDPRLKTVRRHFPATEYRTRLYRVRWPEMDGSSEPLDNRLISPEVALL